MEVNFEEIPIWVQMHGLPMGQTTKLKASWPASKEGRGLEVDFRSPRNVWVTQFIRMRILLNIAKPLCPGFFLPRENREDACSGVSRI